MKKQVGFNEPPGLSASNAFFHDTVTSGDWTGALILIGRADQSLSSPGTVSVRFDSPQSKLASMFFLDLEGTLRIS